MKTFFFTLALLEVAMTGAIVFISRRMYKSMPPPMKVLGIFYAIDLLFSSTLIIMGKMHLHNLFVANIQLPITYACYTWALSRWVSNIHVQKILVYSIPVFILTCITLFLTVEDFFQFSSISLPLSITLLLLFSVYVLVTILKDTSIHVTSQPRFWISSGLVMYNGGNATFFLMLQLFVSGSMDALKLATVYHNIIGNIAYMLFLTGFLCQQKILNSLKSSS